MATKLKVIWEYAEKTIHGHGKDSCGRKIHRISALGNDSDYDGDGPPEAQKAWPRSGPPVGNKQEKWLQEPWNKS